MKPTIVEKCNRGNLAEGRNSGMAFAFVKENENTYETVMPHSPCKDFLNEPVFTENTGIGTKIYGLSYPKKLGIFEKEMNMSIKMMPRHGSNSYCYSNSLAEDEAKLKNNYKNMQKLINHFETALGLKKKTRITSCNDGYFLIKGSKDWTVSTVAISLYTLLLRVAMVYDGETEPIAFLKSYKYNGEDASLLKPSIPKLEKFIKEKKLPEQPPYEEAAAKKNYWQPHNVGIVSY